VYKSISMSFLNGNSGNKSTILITGGATGIGLALAKRFLALGHVVIAVGRRQNVLIQAQKENPGLHIVQGDVGSETNRVAIFDKVIKEFPDINVLINNAGICDVNASALKDTTAKDWQSHKDTIEINLMSAIHLSILFIPHLITKPNSLIANNSSILAFFPIAESALYSASKGEYLVLVLILFHLWLSTYSRFALLHDVTSPSAEGHKRRGGGNRPTTSGYRHGSSVQWDGLRSIYK
jgi:uncharacterized oxidoreductase